MNVDPATDVFEWQKRGYRWNQGIMKVEAYMLECPDFCSGQGLSFIGALRLAEEPKTWVVIRPTCGKPASTVWLPPKSEVLFP